MAVDKFTLLPNPNHTVAPTLQSFEDKTRGVVCYSLGDARELSCLKLEEPMARSCKFPPGFGKSK
jgi:hypothetical protein